MKLLNFLNGYKTFIIGICAIVYGVYTKNSDAIIMGSGLIGIRQSVYSMEQKILPTILNK